MGNMFVLFVVIAVLIEVLVRAIKKSSSGSFRYLFYAFTVIFIVWSPYKPPTYANAAAHTYATALGTLIGGMIVSGIGTGIIWGIAKLFGLTNKEK